MTMNHLKLPLATNNKLLSRRLSFSAVAIVSVMIFNLCQTAMAGQFEEDEHLLQYNRLRRNAPSGGKKEEPLFCGDSEDGEEVFYDYYLNGLPKSGAGDKKRVVIVGAGISGLTAAKMLRDAGHDIVVLESTNRVGGRIQTYRQIQEGWHAELGPMRIPVEHKFTLELVKRANLELINFQSEASPFHYYIRDHLLQKSKLVNGELKKYYKAYEVAKINGSRVNPGKLMGAAMEEPLADLRAMKWKDFVEKYDKYSLTDWLIQKFNYTHEAVEMIGVFLNIEAFLEISMAEIVVDECVFFTPQLKTIPAGMDQLPRSMLEELEPFIEYRSKVSSVIRDKTNGKNNFTVSISCSDVDCSDDYSDIYGDAILITTTATVASTIHFTPPLSQNKAAAMRKAHYNPSTKIIMVFHTPFWEHSNSTGGNRVTDLPLKVMYYPYHASHSGVGVLLASYTWGTDALRYTGMTDDDVIEECLVGLAKLHSMTYDEIKGHFMNAHIKRWSTDPNTLGAFLTLKPYQVSAYQDELSRSENDIYFAGEHTALPHGWINTAIKTGVRAAAEIHLGHDYSSSHPSNSS